jgi:hypothetical protein
MPLERQRKPRRARRPIITNAIICEFLLSSGLIDCTVGAKAGFELKLSFVIAYRCELVVLLRVQRDI